MQETVITPENNVIDGSKNEAEFRDDYRVPQVTFGHCTITGSWGPVVLLDLGDVLAPTMVRAEDNSLSPTYVTFERAAMFSLEGLERITAWFKNQENPIPQITPALVYKWVVLYTDGSSLSQFENDPDTNEEIEHNSKLIDKSRIAQFNLVPRYDSSDNNLPVYTFVQETGEFYCGGQKIETGYDGEHPYDPAKCILFYARKVQITYASQMNNLGLGRSLDIAHSSVLQLLGWKYGEMRDESVPSCILAIDERGNCREHEFSR